MIVYLQDGVFHAFECERLEHRLFGMTKETAMHDWPMSKWHLCCFEEWMDEQERA